MAVQNKTDSTRVSWPYNINYYDPDPNPNSDPDPCLTTLMLVQNKTNPTLVFVFAMNFFVFMVFGELFVGIVLDLYQYRKASVVRD
jgi:hypothetical protein